MKNKFASNPQSLPKLYNDDRKKERFKFYAILDLVVDLQNEDSKFIATYQWCVKHYGQEDVGWAWDLTEDRNRDVFLFKTEQDLSWFMLKFGGEL